MVSILPELPELDCIPLFARYSQPAVNDPVENDIEDWEKENPSYKENPLILENLKNFTLPYILSSATRRTYWKNKKLLP